MPPPTVTPYRVGKNAAVSIDGTAVKCRSGTINKEVRTENLINSESDGFDEPEITSQGASGDLSIALPQGDTTGLAEGQYITLAVVDGDYVAFNGVALITRVSDGWAAEGAWNQTFSFVSRGDYTLAIETP